jgi:hypothetical protein
MFMTSKPLLGLQGFPSTRRELHPLPKAGKMVSTTWMTSRDDVGNTYADDITAFEFVV